MAQEAPGPEPTLTASAQEDGKSEDIDSLVAQATAHYAQKNYRTAADFYSRATERQAKANGEMSTDNADLLYAYGRCLYRVAIEKSDVLGSKVAGEERTQGASTALKVEGSDVKSSSISKGGDELAGDTVGSATKESNGTIAPTSSGTATNKPFFQISGDENFDASEDEEEEEGQNGENAAARDDEDEFSNAFEILDLARVLLRRKLGGLEASGQESPGSAQSNDAIKKVKEKLADTHDLQAEISLEGEQFQNAVNDLRSALALKQGLYPPESSLIAEMHYKLSLALEFSSVTQPRNENGDVDQNGTATVNETMREEAALEMEAAIRSCKLRIGKEQKSLLDVSSEQLDVAKKSIEDVNEMVQDMEQRLVELRQPAVSIDDPKRMDTLDSSTLGGILGSILGESADVQKARIEQVTKGANDLTGLVKRKRPTSGETSDPAQDSNVNSSNKRKVGFVEEVEELGTGKKAKVEDDSD